MVILETYGDENGVGLGEERSEAFADREASKEVLGVYHFAKYYKNESVW